MAAPFSDIETKAELAMVRHLNSIGSSLAGVTIHAGVDPANLPLPAIVCNVASADEQIKFTGQYAVEVSIMVLDNADDTSAATHRERIARVRDELSNDWIGASLSGHVADFSAVGVVLQESSQAIEDRHWIATIPVLVHCRPSD